MASDEAKKIIKNTKSEIWSIPNIMSYFRFLLIPVFIVLYVNGYGLWSLVTLVLSGITDVLDGKVARKYNMVTNLGKFIDPVADKFTQAAMIICVALKFPTMWFLLAIHVTKELIMLYIGFHVLNKTGTVNSSKWYGKLCTALLYFVMMLHIVWTDIPILLSNILVFVCAGMIIFCFVMYSLYFRGLIIAHKQSCDNTLNEESDNA